jgi:hypothetical protein
MASIRSWARSAAGYCLERFRAKWMPVRVKKTRQNKNLEPRSDSIGTEKALDRPRQDCEVQKILVGMAGACDREPYRTAT